MTSDLTPETLEFCLREATTRLLATARELTYNPLAEDCRYIFSEITNNQSKFTEKQRFAWLNTQRPAPRHLADIMPEVLRHYDNFYDINLYIHQAYYQVTIIDIRYYAKSSLPTDYQQQVALRAPTLHAKIALPYWRSETRQKFDINWKVYAPVSSIRRWALTLKWHLLTYIYQPAARITPPQPHPYPRR